MCNFDLLKLKDDGIFIEYSALLTSESEITRDNYLCKSESRIKPRNPAGLGSSSPAQRNWRKGEAPEQHS
ncbi:hypothetical protein CEXT_607141 [Caerostris extrusa]|uniref:Uncharacterized protein n=1 Tax=Caerostris extrusa TaxID=172846 RepID=A0AAV4NFY6_CAEEX|nr:hypothetical protein CEXT_607141 [Caerostris extrusa]